MKQIALISRIDNNNPEYENLYGNNQSPIIKNYPFNNPEYIIYIIKGEELHNGTNKEITDNIINKISLLNKNEETIIAYHYNNDITVSLNKALSKDGWTKVTVKQYSSGGNNQPPYNILIPLGEKIKNGKTDIPEIEALFKYFSIDWKLEASLEFLHTLNNTEDFEKAKNAINIVENEEYTKVFGKIKSQIQEGIVINVDNLDENLIRFRDELLSEVV